MAEKRYEVASEAGAEWHRLEKAKAADYSETKVGDEFQADLGERELPLVAAGWVVEANAKAKEVK